MLKHSVNYAKNAPVAKSRGKRALMSNHRLDRDQSKIQLGWHPVMDISTPGDSRSETHTSSQQLSSMMESKVDINATPIQAEPNVVKLTNYEPL